jgi:histidinol-phosphate aminotransferase
MYTVSAEVNAVTIRTIPLTYDFDIDVDLTKKTWDVHTKLLFLCSPNNPSGNLLDLDKVQILLQQFPGIVIVDEAYIDFTNYDGFVPLLNNFPNLVILQTLSKAWGLASLRLGMCFASKEIVAVLNKIKPPYNINGITQQIVLKSLEEIEQKNKWVAEIIDARGFVENELVKIPAVQIVYPSQANFLLIKITNAKSVYESLILKGIVLRDRSNVLLCGDCLRITIGTSEENKILISELSNL